MRRAGLAVAVLVILATMLAGAYAMEAYAPAGVVRIAATWGTARDGGSANVVDVIGVDPSVLRALRSRASNDAAWTSAVRVVVENSVSGATPPPVIGRYTALRDRIRFEPAFPFAPAVGYRVEVELSRLDALAGVTTRRGRAGPLTHHFSPPATIIDRATKVVAVHPAADRVPSNMLRWYIEFSAPMEPGSAKDHVQLLDEAGREVADAFLRVDEELWDAERKRLTLLFDPGRVKRGVRANVEMGAPLVAGRRYQLRVDPAWRDARGANLTSGFDKAFDVGPADRASPDPARWTLTLPRADTRQPLRVTFGEPLDHALIARMLRVESGGRSVDGTITVALGDSTLSFAPSSPWRSGAYAIRVDARLEDLAGNSVARIFDADRQGGAPPAEATDRARAWRTIEFRVR